MEDLKQFLEPIDMYKKRTMQQMRVPTVKDKTPNPVQLTAEQLIADPDLHMMQDIKLPSQKIMSQDELEDYKHHKRNSYEEAVRRQKFHIGTWIKFAEWEFNIKEYRY